MDVLEHVIGEALVVAALIYVVGVDLRGAGTFHEHAEVGVLQSTLTFLMPPPNTTRRRQLIKTSTLSKATTQLNQILRRLLSKLLQRLAELFLSITQPDHLPRVEPTRLLGLGEEAVVRGEGALFVQREVRAVVHGFSLVEGGGDEAGVSFPA